MELKHADLLQAIAEKKTLDDAITQQLQDVLQQFTSSFKASVKA